MVWPLPVRENQTAGAQRPHTAALSDPQWSGDPRQTRAARPDEDDAACGVSNEALEKCLDLLDRGSHAVPGCDGWPEFLDPVSNHRIVDRTADPLAEHFDS